MNVRDYPSKEKYDLLLVGSGFGSLFFLKKYLAKAHDNVKVCIIEKGPYTTPQEQIKNRYNSPLGNSYGIKIMHDQKPWNFTTGLGGGTNCWFGQSPRMLPNDFNTFSLYAKGKDWPLSYEDLEEYYCEAEGIMGISGPTHDYSFLPRSSSFPLPPHNPSSIDKVMLNEYPESHMLIPTARSSIRTEKRGQCCSAGDCSFCPMNAKFNAFNGLMDVFSDPRVEVLLEADVKQFDVFNDHVAKVVYLKDNAVYSISSELFVLGANAIFNTAILARSGLHHAFLGKGINEQVGYSVLVNLNGLKNFDGSTLTTTLNYSQYDGPHRKNGAAVLMFFENRWKITGFRKEFMRWRELLPITFNVEDLPNYENMVHVPDEWDEDISVLHNSHSDYADLGIQRALNSLPELLRPLPVEDIVSLGYRDTESHILGTTIMGDDPNESIVDKNLIHHTARNLVVVGSSVFPSTAPANPSLTVAALSLLSASKLH